MLKIKNSKKFNKDLKKYRHQKSVITELDKVLSLLANYKPLPRKCCDHLLEGKWSNHHECHIKPDMLLIYITDEKNLYLERFGSHSELF